MSRRDVIGEAGERPRDQNENENLVELHKQKHPQNFKGEHVEERIKDKQEPKPRPISTYLALFQWILLIFCVVSNIYLLTEPSVQCECNGLNAQSQTISMTPTTDSPTNQPTSHPFVRSSADPTQFPSTQAALNTPSEPSLDPTVAPTLRPSTGPTKQPTIVPSFAPTKGATAHPSLAPSDYPSQSPTYFDGYFVGDYKFSFRNTNHGFWLLCHGQWLDITQYSLLYDVIGSQFGHYYNSTKNISYFKVPDARDTVMGVVGSVHSLGQHIGNETYRLSESEMPEHIHYFVGDHSTNSCGAGSGVYITRSCEESSNFNYAFEGTDAFQTEFQTSVGGSGESFSLMQPTKFIGNLFVYSGEIH